MNQKEKFFKALQNAQTYHANLLERNKEILWNDFQGESADEEIAPEQARSLISRAAMPVNLLPPP